jgi:Zn-dependent alcohol dehydrogenase
VVVAFYTRSCGVCKELLKEFQAMCDEAKAAQVSRKQPGNGSANSEAESRSRKQNLFG